jgi:hypothetical protein
MDNASFLVEIKIQAKTRDRLAMFYFSPEDGGSMFLRYVGIYLQVHTVL